MKNACRFYIYSVAFVFFTATYVLPAAAEGYAPAGCRRLFPAQACPSAESMTGVGRGLSAFFPILLQKILEA